MTRLDIFLTLRDHRGDCGIELLPCHRIGNLDRSNRQGQLQDIVPGNGPLVSPRGHTISPLRTVVLTLVLASLPQFAGAEHCVSFHRGDSNGDGAVDISDAIFTLDCVFRGQACGTCDDAMDANDDGVLDVSDGVRVLLHLFGRIRLPAPLTNCGTDSTPDSLGCESSPCQPGGIVTDDDACSTLEISDPKNTTYFFVSPAGRDTWSGRHCQPTENDGPFQSIARARDAVRKLEPLERPVHVFILPGLYSLDEPLVFLPQDSGTENARIIYEGVGSPRPIVSGGCRVEMSADPEHAKDWRGKPDCVPANGPPQQLFVNGQWATRAREPDISDEPNDPDYYFMRDRKFYGTIDGKVKAFDKKAFGAKLEDVAALLSLVDSNEPSVRAQLERVVLVAYHRWSTSRHWIETVENDGTVIVKNESHFPFLDLPLQRYHYENFPSALDTPGEWFSDAESIHYKPFDYETPRCAESVIPVIEKLVVFEGRVQETDPSKIERVEYITLRGLSFRHAAYFLPVPEGGSNGGFSGRQAAADDDESNTHVGAAIEATWTRQIAIENCEVSLVAGYGIWFGLGCRGNRVERCHLHDLGGGGVRIGVGTDTPPCHMTDTEIHTAMQTGDNTVYNNLIHAGGLLFPDAVGIHIGHSGENTIEHNEISELGYTGISVGWLWHQDKTDEPPPLCGPLWSPAKENCVNYNRVYNIGRRILSDMGGIYTLGYSNGTTITHNVVHDIYPYNLYGDGGVGIYADQFSSNLTIDSNLVYNTETAGYNQNSGSGNVVSNNIFAWGAQHQIRLNKIGILGVDHAPTFTFERNIVAWSADCLDRENAAALFGGNTDDEVLGAEGLVFDRNVYWNAAGNYRAIFPRPLAIWRELFGLDRCSRLADPGFIAPFEFDFRLHPSQECQNPAARPPEDCPPVRPECSPASDLGFLPFDHGRAGLCGDPDWVNLGVARRSFSPPPAPKEPPESRFFYELEERFDAERAIPGVPHVNGGESCHDAGDGWTSLVRPTDESGLDGRSLKVIAGSDGSSASYPEIYYRPGHRSGTSRCSFDVFVDRGTRFQHEWRDDQGRRVLALRIVDHGDFVGVWDQDVLLRQFNLPDNGGIAVSVAVTAKLGPCFDGLWDVKLTIAGEKTEHPGNVVLSCYARTLGWLGFLSDAKSGQDNVDLCTGNTGGVESPRYFLLDNVVLTSDACPEEKINAVVQAPPPVAEIDWVTVKDPNNDPDPQTGFGAVSEPFVIAMHEVTNSQWAAFLNRVDPQGKNALGLFDERMDAHPSGGIEYVAEACPGSKYVVRAERGRKPVVFVDWFGAVRFCNWLHNDQGGAGSTEDGAYEKIAGGPLTDVANDDEHVAIARTAGAKYYVPSENEWYKAAYFSRQGTYFDYATQSDESPMPEPPPGGKNSANTLNSVNDVTDVGAYIKALSAYGTFDQCGNVEEWTEDATRAGLRVIRGGSWDNDTRDCGSANRALDAPCAFAAPSQRSGSLGFRLARSRRCPLP